MTILTNAVKEWTIKGKRRLNESDIVSHNLCYMFIYGILRWHPWIYFCKTTRKEESS